MNGTSAVIASSAFPDFLDFLRIKTMRSELIAPKGEKSAEIDTASTKVGNLETLYRIRTGVSATFECVKMEKKNRVVAFACEYLS